MRVHVARGRGGGSATPCVYKRRLRPGSLGGKTFEKIKIYKGGGYDPTNSPPGQDKKKGRSTTILRQGATLKHVSRPLQEPPAPRGGRKKKVIASQAKTRKAFATAFTGNQAPLGCVRSCLSHNHQSHGEKNHSPSSTATDSKQQLSAPLAPRPALVRALRSVVPPHCR